MKLHYEVFGEAPVEIVVEAGLLACAAEWRPLAKALAADYGVLLYERAGAGTSERSDQPRMPRVIAQELYALLAEVAHAPRLVLIGHSQGGLYAQQFARLYPELVRGLVLLDPLTAVDNQFKVLLTPEEYKQGGVDKFANLSAMKRLLRMRMGFLVKAMMKKAPPMYYYDFSAEDRAYILGCLARLDACETAEEEYRLAHDETQLGPLRTADGFPRIPLALVTHSSALAEKETMAFGQASPEVARKVEAVWQELMGEYLRLSPTARLLRAEKSTHYIHLMQPEIVHEALAWIESQSEAAQ